MKDWLTTDLPDYIAQNQVVGGLFVFQHIPKTAGSSIVYEITDHIGQYHPIFIDYSNLPAVGGVDDLMMVSTQAMLDGYTPQTMRCTSGHLRRKHIDHIKTTLPEAKFCTFLRDPVDRVISDYRYQCTDQHPPYLEFREKFPTIEDYVAVRGMGDKMWHFMIDDDIPVEEGIARIEERYCFVGLKEMYPMSINIMLMLNGADAMPKARVRTTKNIQQNRVEITPALRAQILEMNPKDQALYEHFRGLLVARRDSWRTMKQEASLARLAEREARREARQAARREMATADGS